MLCVLHGQDCMHCIPEAAQDNALMFWLVFTRVLGLPFIRSQGWLQSGQRANT